ncbi:MAG: hypothetical protein HY263_10875 [Chloroflexi bacterium]|nr:hypothetical protein [Chloroflexota bacterium]
MERNLDTSTGPRCNIGAAEIHRRRRLAVALAIATVVVAIGLAALDVPQLGRLALWPFAAATGVTWLQVTQRFCVRFGLFGLENFGRLGQERRVASQLLEADQRRALKLIAEGALAGLVATLVFVVLPL